MMQTRYPRPCPIPGHPQDEDEPVLVTESAWARLRAWHLQAPAERLPLPVILTAWPVAWFLHAAHVAGHVVTYAAVAAAVACWLTWHRYGRNSPHPRLLPTEAALVAAAAGGWMAAAVTWGPLGWPAHLLTWIYLAGADGRVLVAAPSPGRPGCPPAPRGRRRLGGPQGRMAPGRSPDRPGRLPPAEGHRDAARRGAAAHQRPGQRTGHPRRGEQPTDRREVRAPARPALRPGGHQDHRLPGPAGHRGPGEGPVGQRPGHPPGPRPGLAVHRLVPRTPPASATRSRSGSSRRPASRWTWSCGTRKAARPSACTR